MHMVDRDNAASKGFVTTTSEFAPGVAEEFKAYMPTRLELRDRKALFELISKLAKS